MITLTTIQIWSEVDQAVVDWTVGLESDDNGNSVVVARHNDEFYKFSPNTTDEELNKQVTEINQGK